MFISGGNPHLTSRFCEVVIGPTTILRHNKIHLLVQFCMLFLFFFVFPLHICFLPVVSGGSCVWITILVCIQDDERLQNFITWAITTALASESSQRLRSNESRVIVKRELGEESRDDSLVSKFLRWLTASVIIGKLHLNSNDIYSVFSETRTLESLHSLLVRVENTSGQKHDINIDCEELLASTIFYLQLLPGINQELLPSVVSALCLLTFGASNLSGTLLYISIHSIWFAKWRCGDRSELTIQLDICILSIYLCFFDFIL